MTQSLRPFLGRGGFKLSVRCSWLDATLRGRISFRVAIPLPSQVLVLTCNLNVAGFDSDDSDDRPEDASLSCDGGAFTPLREEFFLEP